MRLLILTALLLSPALAVADDAPAKTTDAHKMATDDCARARKQNKTCVIDMGSEQVEGETAVPKGTQVAVRDYIRFTSLIRVRTDFIVEILKTTEDLD